MKTNRKRRVVLMVLMSVMLVLFGCLSVVYANDLPSGKDVATQHDIHLHSVVQLSDGSVPPGKDCPITGNIFTFTHFLEGHDYQGGGVIYGTPDSGTVINWSSNNRAIPTRPGRISGSFHIDKNPAPLFWDDRINFIYVSFNGRSQYVPPYGENDVPCYNFKGAFKITGGTGFYEGICGSGTISRTFHDHEWGGGFPNETWLDFVMIGKAYFP